MHLVFSLTDVMDLVSHNPCQTTTTIPPELGPRKAKSRFQSRNVLGFEIPFSNDSEAEMFWALRLCFQTFSGAKCFGLWSSVFKLSQRRVSSVSKVEMFWALMKLMFPSVSKDFSFLFGLYNSAFKRFQSRNVLGLGVLFSNDSKVERFWALKIC